jgi:hypothetical protein
MLFSEDEREHNGYSLQGRAEAKGAIFCRKKRRRRLVFRPMDKTRTVLRGAHPSYTDPAINGAETAQNCVLSGAET